MHRVYPIECTAEPIPDDGSDYVCYGTIVYTTVFGDDVATSWKHSVTRVQMLRDGKVLKGLKTDALPGGYSSEWAEPKKSAAGEPKAQRELAEPLDADERVPNIRHPGASSAA